MGLTVKELLEGKTENHLLPFFWQHGEDEATLRKYMQVIHDSNCHAVCVESRPHPDFCGEKWWADMDIILDEAKQRNMKVWILDDSHFPTGYANGAVKDAPDALKRRSIYCRTFHLKTNRRHFQCNFQAIVKKIPTTLVGGIMNRLQGDGSIHYDGDRILSVCANVSGEVLPVSWHLEGEKLSVTLPEGVEKLYVTFATRNAGIHRNYINMLDRESCRLLIDAMYEPHYNRYKNHFGKTIAGFFSDEPEIAKPLQGPTL